MDNALKDLDIYNVTRLNREVRAVLEGGFPQVWVQGEISNLAQPGSGHIYFSLKDEFSQVRCAMFKNRKQLLKFNPENGALVLLRANVSLYENRGEYQLIVEYMEPAGDGALQRAFEELKQKLLKEGLFDESHKKPVPLMPACIGVITSPTGAAIRDILTVLRRRYPLAQVIIYPVQVQGTEAPVQIINMLKTASTRNECEVLLLARGGGSLEDLWAFNNEQLARTIYTCPIPVVTGIGHEVDFTIADFVADQRAATPSAAAELVSPDQMQLRSGLEQLLAQLQRVQYMELSQYRKIIEQLRVRLPHPVRQLQMLSQRTDELQGRSLRATKSTLIQKRGWLDRVNALLKGQHPGRQLREQQLHFIQLEQALQRLIKSQLLQISARINQLGHNLDTVSPLSTLGRGFAIVQQLDGTAVRASAQLHVGEKLNARFAEGSAALTVDCITKAKKL